MIYFNKLTKIPSKIRHCENPVIAELPSLRGSKATEAISSRIRHCEALKKEGAISFKFSSLRKSPSLRGVSETNDEAISFKIPFKIP